MIASSFSPLELFASNLLHFWISCSILYLFQSFCFPVIFLFLSLPYYLPLISLTYLLFISTFSPFHIICPLFLSLSYYWPFLSHLAILLVSTLSHFRIISPPLSLIIPSLFLSLFPSSFSHYCPPLSFIIFLLFLSLLSLSYYLLLFSLTSILFASLFFSLSYYLPPLSLHFVLSPLSFSHLFYLFTISLPYLTTLSFNFLLFNFTSSQFCFILSLWCYLHPLYLSFLSLSPLSCPSILFASSFSHTPIISIFSHFCIICPSFSLFRITYLLLLYYFAPLSHSNYLPLLSLIILLICFLYLSLQYYSPALSLFHIICSPFSLCRIICLLFLSCR